MNTLALSPTSDWLWRAGWAAGAVLGTILVLNWGVSLNQALALMLTSMVLLIFANDRANGLIAALLFFMVKPVIVRIAYAFDKNYNGSGGFDLLGITPALLLAGIIVWQLYCHFANGRKITEGRTRLYLVIFAAIAFLSIFNPANSILVGLGGFERNVLPNMLVLLTASYVLTDFDKLKKYIKVFLVLGLISCIYAIGQYFSGLYPWEKDWFLDVAFAESSAGWLTIGLKGVEFRLFSVFYNYMDFTFCNVLIFSLAISIGTTLTGPWKKIRIWYIVSWAVVLLLTLERMPLLMSFIALAVVFYFNSTKEKRKKIIWKSLAAFAIFVAAISVASPYMKETGADKLIRLAELANPLTANSIDDRMQRKWGPTFQTISSNPLGVGIGYGSQTKARSIAAKSNYWVEPHNELLQKTLETGIFGGLIFLLLLISVFRDSIKMSHCSKSVRRLGIGFVGVTIGFWLCGMVNVPFSGSSGLLYWATAGAVLGLSDNLKRTSHPVKTNPETADIPIS